MRRWLVMAGLVAAALGVGTIAGMAIGQSMPDSSDPHERLAIEAELRPLPWAAVRQRGRRLWKREENCAALLTGEPENGTCWYYDVYEARVGIAVAPGEDGPLVGFDRDGDDTIDESEWTPARDIAGRQAVVVELEVSISGEVVSTELLVQPAPDGDSVRVTEQMVGGVAHLPEGPVAMRATARDGWFGGARTRIWVESSGDGHARATSRFELRFNGQFIPVRDAFYRVSISPDGHRAALVPVEADGEFPFPGHEAPSFQVTDEAQRAHSLEQYDGHWLVLAFWASWCGPCKGDQSTLDRLRTAHPNLRILGLGTDDRPQLARRVLRARPHAYPMVLRPDAAMVEEAYDVRMLPTYVLIDPHGMVSAVGDADAMAWMLETAGGATEDE